MIIRKGKLMLKYRAAGGTLATHPQIVEDTLQYTLAEGQVIYAAYYDGTPPYSQINYADRDKVGGTHLRVCRITNEGLSVQRLGGYPTLMPWQREIVTWTPLSQAAQKESGRRALRHVGTYDLVVQPVGVLRQAYDVDELPGVTYPFEVEDDTAMADNLRYLRVVIPPEPTGRRCSEVHVPMEQQMKLF